MTSAGRSMCGFWSAFGIDAALTVQEQKKDHMADLERAVKETFSSFVARNVQLCMYSKLVDSLG